MLSENKVAATFEMQLDDLRTCYGRVLEEQRTLIQALSYRVYLDPNGQVQHVEQVSPGKNPDLVTCVSRALESWNFPATNGKGIGAVETDFQFGFDAREKKPTWAVA